MFVHVFVVMCRPYHHPPVWLQAWVRRPALMGNTPPPATPTSLWSERSASQSAAVQPETPAASVSHRVGVFFQYVWVYESRGLVVSLFNRLAFNNNNNKVIISSSPSANETVFFSMEADILFRCFCDTLLPCQGWSGWAPGHKQRYISSHDTENS